ncbi:signal peptidase I [Candidatus Peregrinibacteria bacterium CG10_big_fil_rev_8_21_14_0_10_49_24]|nr:MAG: signal peptidase I [Candidatus Peregrinibacteria bacterium CG11_big_fil_rev_8_21_14_0_20_49_14]PIR51037.1 MAG: signal peptidase I [Candidatus Peregrinibacteria bacterium CG10_big_fil_rev_8_21_14_0_10_49_24]PJA67590.1 MAG: signal peptidase I [Candidatus Peregrinibacteria bacterium CG_4_9_14_3_um_filter_49_12]
MSPKKHGLLFHLLDVILNIVIIVTIVVVIRTFLVSPFQVEGSSMVGTLEHREYIIINKLAYYIGSPNRGDVVVFRPPNDMKKHYVKRIIGIPGDTVILRDGYVYVQEKGGAEVKLQEDYLNERNKGHTYSHPPTSGNTEERRYEVPEGSYFLLGDNRQGSLDSRSFSDDNGNFIPFVEEGNIKGLVWFIALPITKIQALEPPNYRM